MTGRTCPECGRPTATEEGVAGASPVCGCADFDPLRVRPYVPLLPPAEGDEGPPAELLAEPTPAQEVAYEYEHEAAGHHAPVPERRRRPGALVVAVAVVAVLGSVAFAGSLLAGGDHEGGEALPDVETLAPFLSAAPDAPSADDSSSVSPGGSASASRSPSPSSSASRSASPSASPSRSSAAAPATTTVATGQVSAPATSSSAATLGPGDSGPEVVELQERLDQVWLYDGPPHGQYDGRVENAVATYQAYRGITTDPRGTYGPATRRALEAETEYPSTGDDGDGDGDWDGDHGNGGGRGGRG